MSYVTSRPFREDYQQVIHKGFSLLPLAGEYMDGEKRNQQKFFAASDPGKRKRPRL
jgi:hypothetical protein